MRVIAAILSLMISAEAAASTTRSPTTEDNQVVRLEDVPGASRYQGRLRIEDRLLNFRTSGPWIILPSDATIEAIEAIGPKGHRLKAVEAKQLPPAKPAPGPAIDLSPLEPAPRDPDADKEPQPETPIVEILSYEPEWKRIGSISLSLGIRSETASGKGGITEYTADHSANPLVLTFETPADGLRPWNFGLTFTHASSKQKTTESVEDGQGSFPEQNEAIGLDRQALYAKRTFRISRKASWLAGLSLRLEHWRYLRAADATSGAGEIARRHVTALAFEGGYDHKIRPSLSVGMKLTVAPDVTTLEHDGYLAECELRVDYALQKELAIFAAAGYRLTHTDVDFPCPENADCDSKGVTNTAEIHLLLGLQSAVYIP